MNSDEVHQELRKFSFTDYIDSGARGSWDQAKQLVLSRGYVSDATGKIRPKLIRSNLVGGLSQQEFFDSSWGARKGLLDTALSTGDSGYLTRQLIYSTVTIELGDVDDCGTTDYFEIKIRNKAQARAILWRYYLNEDGELEEIKRRTYRDLVGKTIKLRSPVYCKSKHICKTCYGNLYKTLHSIQIGIIATQAVGERVTQLVLRTFHLSGVAQTSGAFEQQEDIISGISIANKLFHSPGDLNKVDQPGEKIEAPEDLVNAIFEVFSQYGGIHMVHYEIIVSAMMWADDNPWRLTPSRESKPFKWTSILQIPNKSSWLLGVAFSNLKPRIIDGLVNAREDDDNCITDLFKL
jgi:hypothetical protein